MVTARQVLKALVEYGYATEATMKRYSAYFDPKVRYSSPEIKSDCVSMSDETFGRKSVLFFVWKDKDLAGEFARILGRMGATVDYKWYSENPCAYMVSVSHFKGWHWWE